MTNKFEPRKMTPEESQLIDQIGSVISQVMVQMNVPKHIGICAMTELILVVTADKCKTEQEYIDRMRVLTNLMMSSAYTSAKTLVEKNKEYEKNKEKFAREYARQPKPVEVRVVPMDQLQDVLAGLEPTKPPTKH